MSNLQVEVFYLRKDHNVWEFCYGHPYYFFVSENLRRCVTGRGRATFPGGKSPGRNLNGLRMIKPGNEAKAVRALAIQYKLHLVVDELLEWNSGEAGVGEDYVCGRLV